DLFGPIQKILDILSDLIFWSGISLSIIFLAVFLDLTRRFQSFSISNCELKIPFILDTSESSINRSFSNLPKQSLFLFISRFFRSVRKTDEFSEYLAFSPLSSKLSRNSLFRRTILTHIS